MGATVSESVQLSGMAEEATTESGDDPDLDPDHTPDLDQQFTFASWTGPKFIFKKVHKWAVKDWGKSPRKSIGWFLQYCWAFCESEEEEDEMFVWMLSLIGLYVKEDGWDGFCQGALRWDWSQVAVRDSWEIPAPEWASRREEDDIRNGLVETVVVNKDEDSVKKVNGDGKEGEEEEGDREEGERKEGEWEEGDGKEGDGKKGGEKSCDRTEYDSTVGEMKKGEECAKEDLKERCEEDCVERDKSVKIEEGTVLLKADVLEMEEAGEAAFPCSPWGSQLPPPTPSNLKPLYSWRPWEVAKPRKWKKRSPASQARSLRRLREWQEQRDLQRGLDQFTSPNTPLPPPREVRNVRLVNRLEGEGGGKFGSQAFPLSNCSGSQIPPASSPIPYLPSSSGSQTVSCLPSWSGSQTIPCSPLWSGSQTIPPPPWSGNQGALYQDNRLSASTFSNQTMLQQSFSPLASLPSPIPWSSPPSLPSWTGPADRCTWGTLPALVTMCPSCHAWGLMTPK